MSSSDVPGARLRRSVALVWRTLRSMRTAVILLLMLAAASVVGGTIFPQLPNSAPRVARFMVDHPFWGKALQAAGFFDVFGSWWFALITALLFVSLVACLIPRSRAMIRTARQRPIQARELESFPSYAERRVAASPPEAAGKAASVLRRKRYRVELDERGGAVAAEKGALREVGSLVFHWAFLLLLVAVIFGKGTGYVGHATIVEGSGWTDARLNYDGQLRTGRFFDGGFSGTQITLEDFNDAYRDTGQPMDYRSTLDLANADGSVTRTAEVRINHPVMFNGIRIFQYGYGWAAMVRVAEGNEVLFDGPVILGQDTPKGENPLAQPWIGTVKLPTLRPQVGIALEVFPDAEAYFRSIQTGVPQPMTQDNAPFIDYQVWEGKLVDNSLTGLDTRFMRLTSSGLLGQGWTVNLERGCVVTGTTGALPGALSSVTCPHASGPGVLTMSFPELRQYTTLQISRDASVPYVLGAAILIVLGLLPALYVSRRKVWVRARADGMATILQVGGFSLQRKDRFDEEFAGLVAAVSDAAGPVLDHATEEARAR
jgi:cytochrome c biogenesis protein